VRRPPTPLSLALLALAAAAAARAGDEPRFELAGEAVSRYVFGGLTFSDRPVLHPSLSASVGGFRLTAFGTWYTDADELLEADVFLEYGTGLGRLALYGAVSRYYFEEEQGWRGTTELYAGATWAGPLRPSLSLTEDLGLGDGGLIEAGIGHPIPLGNRSLELSLTLAHNRHYYSERVGLSHLELALELELPLGERLRLRPRLAGLRSLRDDVESAVYGGLRLSLAF
jgi:hypothetical protein